MKKHNNDLAKKYVKDIKSADVWSVFRILSDFVKGFDGLGDLGPTVTMFGSAKAKSSSKYYKSAQKLSSILAKRGFNIMTGGGPGVMEAANRGAFEHKNVESIGLNIDLPFEQIPNSYTTTELSFEYFFSRKVMLVKYSIAYVIFPGGYGTLDEFFEALTLVQTKKITGVKIFLVGTSFYKPLMKFLENKLYKNGMITLEDLHIITLSDDLEQIVIDIENSLLNQIEILNISGLSDTKYCNSLVDFFKDKDATIKKYTNV